MYRRSESEESLFSLYAFGRSSEGQLGLAGRDDLQNVIEMTPVGSAAFKNKTVVDIACGLQHTLILLNDGSLVSCGSNENGQLGRSGLPGWKPDIIPNLHGLRVIQVACGSSHSAALIDDGHVFTWGSNASGQLGIPNSRAGTNGVVGFNGVAEPREVNLSQVVQVACGDNHTMTLSADGSIHAWGDNRFGQIGIGKGWSKYDQPQLVQSLLGIPFRLIVGGGGHSFALSVSGAVFAWGRNRCGQLGVGDMDDRNFPVHVKPLRTQRISHISCGEDYSAALTKDGRLFTFGAGSSGQLGHGSSLNEILPKQVFELMGSKVLNVSCGRCHTLAVINGKLYSFGLAGSGQLGLGGDIRRNRLTPCVVRTNAVIKRVFAGADQSFVLCPTQPSRNLPLPELVPRLPKHLTADIVRELLKNPASLTQELEIIFSNVSCVNGSFLKAKDEHFVTGGKNCGVDMDVVMESFEMLSNSSQADQINRVFQSSLSWQLLPQLTPKPPDAEALRVYAILPWCPVFSKMESLEKLHFPFAQRLNALEGIPWKIIEQWWRGFNTRHLNRILKIFKQAVSTVLSWPAVDSTNVRQRETEIDHRNNILKACLDVLSRLNKVNTKTRKLQFEAFYINELQDKVDVRAAFFRWVMEKQNDGEFSFCNYPFIFNAPVKTMLMQADATLQMQILLNQTHQSNFEALFNPFQRMANPFFELRVSRSNIVEDTIRQVLSTETPYDMKKPLKVIFKDEEAVDEGGVKKEFFLILFQELLHPKYGMFVEDPESRLLWFANCPFEEPTMFQLVGILIGLAVHNLVLVPLPFPLALYKKLLDHAVTLEDLKELHPTEGRSLEGLLDYENDDFEDVFCLNFTLSVSAYEQVRSENLKPDGDRIPVTKENRQEYVDLYVDYKLNKQIKTPFEAFAKGIRPVMSRHIMNFFQPQELREMVGGNEHFDWTEFEKNTAYHGEYWQRHPTILLFWDVFHSLSENEKKKFLLFLTGSARVPLLGMKELKMQIQPTGGGESFLPVAHTCFNLLDLPKYTSAQALKKKLLEAIEHNQGFSLI